MRALVADIIAARIGELDLRYPVVSEAERAELAAAKEALLSEDD